MEILYKIAGVMFSVSIIAFSILFMIVCFNGVIYEYKEAKNKTGYWLSLYTALLISGALIFLAAAGIKGIVLA
ncbi:hypothetical protein [Leptotrichia wadei]|uniref:hypothetical protein n=1 Tax=Leptotrichia wadei TaxID=157687 RepID=UPI0028EE506B|nr:hypothetical protein [Leptotrichia wadei]